MRIRPVKELLLFTVGGDANCERAVLCVMFLIPSPLVLYQRQNNGPLLMGCIRNQNGQRTVIVYDLLWIAHAYQNVSKCKHRFMNDHEQRAASFSYRNLLKSC